jgi:putative exporter of polyketide antibiotics
MEANMLRLLWQELKFRRGAILGWSLGLCFFPLVYIGIYPSVAEQMAAWQIWNSIRRWA